MATQELVAAVLRRAGYRSRLRYLRDRRTAYAPQLVDDLLHQTSVVMRSDPTQSRERARLALYIARALRDKQLKIRCLRALAQAATLAGHHPGALRAIDEALAEVRLGSNPVTVAELKAVRMQVLTQLDRYVEARETGERILQVFENNGHVRGIIRVRMALGELALQLQKPREALRHYRHAEWLIPADAKPQLRAVLAANRANALQACNRFRAAVRWFEQARNLFHATGCDHTVAQMDYNLAYSAGVQGHFEEALVRYERVAEAFARLGDDMHLAHVDLDRAEIHLQINLPDDARGYAERAAERFQALGLQRDRAQAEYFSGRAAAMAGELGAAVANYDTARTTFEELGLLPLQVICLVQQAYVSRRLGRTAEARRLAEEARRLVADESNPLTIAQVELLHANLDLAAGDPDQALSGARAVLARCKRLHAPWLQIEARRIMGRAHTMRGEANDAAQAYRVAIDLLERYRGGVPPDEYMSAFLSARSELYEEIVHLLIERGDLDQAFEFTERAKSRSLLDLLARRMPPTGADLPFARRIRRIRGGLNAAYWQIFRSGGGPDGSGADGISTAHERAARLEEELGRLLRRQSLSAGSARVPAAAETPTLADVQRELGAHEVLLDYLVTRRGLVAFVVTARQLHVVETQVEESEITECLQRFRFHLSKHEHPGHLDEDIVLRATRDNLARLAGYLLDPVSEYLKGRRLIVSAYGPLHKVPFHALPFGDGWLTEAFEIAYAPSGGIYRHCARRRPTATGLPTVFGVPDKQAPQIEAEARRVGRLLSTPHVYLGASATLSRLRDAAASTRILHVATHGMFRSANPALSAIHLSDGWITLHDLYSLRFDGELVVLSTCESGTAGVTPGGDVLGLTRGFLYAGAPALLASQWRLRDDVAPRFMQVFYEMLGAGLDAAAAHRAAMAAIRAERPHPYYWAPFFLMGCPVSKSTSARIDERPSASAALVAADSNSEEKAR